MNAPFRRRRTAHRPSRRFNRCGLTLFEVLLALVIFLAALAAIGQLISTGSYGAVQAKLRSQAVLRAETTMSDVTSGYRGLQGSSGVYADNSAWSWTISVAPTQQSGLYLVEVTAEHKGGSKWGNAKSTLRRFVRDPAVELAAYEAELAAAQAKAAAASSSSSSSSSSGSN